jgi:hypothetical protein
VPRTPKQKQKLRRLPRAPRPLVQANERVQQKGWTNVTVVEADACKFWPPEGTATLITFSYSLSSEQSRATACHGLGHGMPRRVAALCMGDSAAPYLYPFLFMSARTHTLPSRDHACPHARTPSVHAIPRLPSCT